MRRQSSLARSCSSVAPASPPPQNGGVNSKHLVPPMEVSAEAGNAGAAEWLDDDGRPRRKGTFWTASAHIITAVIGSGVLSLAWAIAQLGWVAGPTAMLLVAIGYTIASSISMKAIRRAGCFHTHGHGDPCKSSSTPYMILFGAAQVVFSQIPDFDQIWWLSIVAAVMSFTYSSIGLSLGIVQTVSNGGFKGSLTSIGFGAGVNSTQKVWHTLQAFGDIAFAYSFSNILIEIQDTIKAPPPSESKVMQKATRLSVATTTVFYMLCGCMGYAAFGDDAPDNLLTGFGFYEPFWLLDVANVAIVVHLVGAYQVFCQPIFAFVERRAAAAWPDSAFVSRELRAGPFALSPFRLAWRSAFVCVTTVVAMLLPFFGDVAGLLGAVSFWPLTVYFPVEMYIKQRRVPRGSARWISLQTLSVTCLLVSIAAAAGSIADVVDALKVYRPFSG
ncbi:Amino acid permease 2 [Zea mays]|uniref:Amino acid permease 2 n=1 Tax=Zea mays TaxID=4577 RepID=A0A1D6MYN6_MAIZE|nr:Amino acid permease 2 [Zea mays]